MVHTTNCTDTANEFCSIIILLLELKKWWIKKILFIVFIYLFIYLFTLIFLLFFFLILTFFLLGLIQNRISSKINSANFTEQKIFNLWWAIRSLHTMIPMVPKGCLLSMSSFSKISCHRLPTVQLFWPNVLCTAYEYHDPKRQN